MRGNGLKVKGMRNSPVIFPWISSCSTCISGEARMDGKMTGESRFFLSCIS